jgi:tRNA(Arg) A34 adenosine deaminase TadA
MEAHDEPLLSRASALAATAHQGGEDPFGAVLAAGQQVVHEAYDHCLAYRDLTAHAELLVISEYCRRERRLDLDGYTLYSSAEPCVLCAGAVKWARVSRVVFSVSQAVLQRLSGGRPKPSCDSPVNTGGRRVEVVGPLLPEEGLAVFAGFAFTPKRERAH